MSENATSYAQATRHPWPSLLFLLPLLLAYEGGVLWLGGTHPELLRNGADTWMHRTLEGLGLHQLYWTPALIVVVLLGWSFARRADRPTELVGVLAGMGIESVAFALGLWVLSRELGPLLDALGIPLDVPPAAEEMLAPLITYVGAGIYEETLFRLVLFTALVLAARTAMLPNVLALLVAAAGSAAVFAGAHHVGPFGEKFRGYVFLFRTLAGLYFALLYQLRGFGVAVGAHACYDVLVGMNFG